MTFALSGEQSHLIKTPLALASGIAALHQQQNRTYNANSLALRAYTWRTTKVRSATPVTHQETTTLEEQCVAIG